MDARRGQAIDQVACLQSRPGQQGPALGGADRETGDVEIAGSVNAGHLRRLSADQCAAGLRAPLGDASQDGRHDVLVELAGREIVQEKQRLSALDDNVVDAHRDQVDADRVIDAALGGDLQLGADAVVRRNQDRIDKARRAKIEQSAKSAELRAGPWAARGASQRTYSINDPVACIDVDSQFGVSERLAAFGHRGSGGVRARSA